MCAVENNRIFATNLQYLMDLHKKDRSDLVRDLDLKYTTIANWLQGTRYPRIGKIEQLAHYFNVSKSDLVEARDHHGTSPPLPSNAIPFDPSDTARIPLLGTVIAGEPMYAEQNIMGYVDYDKKKAGSGEYFALRVVGDSMHPQMIEGDVVIVLRQSDVDSGDIAVVMVGDDAATVKKIKKDVNGMHLIGINVAAYEPHFYSVGDIKTLPISIVGKVVQIRRDV